MWVFRRLTWPSVKIPSHTSQPPITALLRVMARSCGPVIRAPARSIVSLTWALRSRMAPVRVQAGEVGVAVDSQPVGCHGDFSFAGVRAGLAQAHLPGDFCLIEPDRRAKHGRLEIQDPVQPHPGAVVTREPGSHDRRRFRGRLYEARLLIEVAEFAD